MKLRERLGKFFTLSKRGNGGFTLVELIVVIAILAILAGVAVPVYSGYVEKANKSADETLIAAINKAAATAVLEANGEDMQSIRNGFLTSNAVKGEINISVYETYTPTSPVVTAFAKYFAGNETAALKWYGSLKFEDGKFVGVESVLKNSLVGNDTVADAFNSSSYATLGVAGMTGMVDTLAGALADYPALNRVTRTGAFGKTLEKLGIDPATADEQTMANAAVFYVADYTSQLEQADIWSHIVDGDLETWLETDAGLGLDSDDALFLGTALRYASATAYAYSDAASPAERDAIANANPQSRGEAMLIIQQATAGDGYITYLYDDAVGAKNGQNDFNAFYEVMKTLEANSNNFSSYGGEGYFSNAELQAEMNRILGTSN